jgi:hypothetical protein
MRYNYRNPWRYLKEWAGRLTPENARSALRRNGDGG